MLHIKYGTMLLLLLLLFFQCNYMYFAIVNKWLLVQEPILNPGSSFEQNLWQCNMRHDNATFDMTMQHMVVMKVFPFHCHSNHISEFQFFDKFSKSTIQETFMY